MDTADFWAKWLWVTFGVLVFNWFLAGGGTW